jgi:hypothetical protein
MKRTMKTTNRIFAMPASADAIPRNPNIPAKIAKMKKSKAHPNIGITFLSVVLLICLLVLLDRYLTSMHGDETVFTAKSLIY